VEGSVSGSAIEQSLQVFVIEPFAKHVKIQSWASGVPTFCISLFPHEHFLSCVPGVVQVAASLSIHSEKMQVSSDVQVIIKTQIIITKAVILKNASIFLINILLNRSYSHSFHE
jgi:hypothetical protein